MYMDYSKLWKTLIDKDVTKTELLELTGISSRVMAKMVKNETVTTDTIARICAALDCKVEDVMECVNDEKMSVYNYYRKFGKITHQNELYRTVEFELNNRKFKIYSTKVNATKATHIHCRDDNTVYWEQLYPFGSVSGPSHHEYVLVKPTRERDEIVVVLINGRPGTIHGLDECIFLCSRNTIKTPKDIYVMSLAAFKLFEPKFD